MLIYRLEHQQSGIGVYRACIDLCLDEDFPKRNNHPLASEDSKLMENLPASVDWHKCYFGFESLNQLKNWFYTNKFLEMIEAAGVVCKVYDVPAAYYGNTQAVFPFEYRCAAYLVKVIQIRDLMD